LVLCLRKASGKIALARDTEIRASQQQRLFRRYPMNAQPPLAEEESWPQPIFAANCNEVQLRTQIGLSLQQIPISYSMAEN
jgi:hypothetical protein